MTNRIEIHTGNDETHRVNTRIELGKQKWIKVWVENHHGMWIKILDSSLDRILDQISGRDQNSNQILDRNSKDDPLLDQKMGDEYHG